MIDEILLRSDAPVGAFAPSWIVRDQSGKLHVESVLRGETRHYFFSTHAASQPLITAGEFCELDGWRFSVEVVCPPDCDSCPLALIELKGVFDFRGVATEQPYAAGAFVNGQPASLKTFELAKDAGGRDIAQNKMSSLFIGMLRLAPGLHEVHLVARRPSADPVSVGARQLFIDRFEEN